MATTLKLATNQVPKELRKIDGYTGRTFRAEITLEVFIASDAGTWSGGTRERFWYVRLSDCALVEASSNAAPWSLARRDNRVRLAPGFAVVERSYFLGKDLGLRFYVHPDDVAKLLPAAA